jgi:lysophospholipase L1-like esterase
MRSILHPLSSILALPLLLLAFTSPAQEAPAARTKIACVGDSITFGAGIKDRQQNSYPAQLQTLLGDRYDVRNFGVSGRTLLKHGDFPYWKEKAFQDAKDFAPNVVIIKLGTNDTKPQNWKFKDEFAADAKALVQEFQKLPSHPTVYLCRPVPVVPPGAFGIRTDVLDKEVIPALDQVAKETGAPVIDLHAVLADHPDLLPDKVHPNAEGAKLMAQAIAKTLTPAKEPVGAK